MKPLDLDGDGGCYTCEKKGDEEFVWSWKCDRLRYPVIVVSSTLCEQKELSRPLLLPHKKAKIHSLSPPPPVHTDRIMPKAEAKTTTTTTTRSSSPLEHVGTATPPQAAPGFPGRGGMWHCETCHCSKMLPPQTLSWKCSQCQATMYTTPPDECPLDTFCPCCCWDTILTRGGG